MPLSWTSTIVRVVQNLRQGLTVAWDASPRSLVFYCALGIVTAALPVVMTYLGAALVDRIAEARLVPVNLLDLWLLIASVWLVAGIQRAASTYAGYGRHLFLRRVQLETEDRLLRHASQLDLGHLDSPEWHDRLARAKRDMSWRPGDLTWSVLTLGSNVVTILLMSTLLASLHGALVCLALGAAVMSLALERHVTARLYDFSYNKTTEDRERDYLGDLLVHPRMAKEIRACGIADHLLGRHQRLTNNLFVQREQLYRSGARVSLASGLTTGTALVLAYGFVAYRGVAGLIEPGAVVMLIGAFTTVGSALASISTTFAAVDQHTRFLDDYFSFLAIGPLVPVPAEPRTLPMAPVGGIEFADVTFAYPGAHAPVVSGFNLRIDHGELIALVGDNGAGKSTFVKLLLRFYDADRGSVRFGGIDVKDLDPNELRQRVGVMFQDHANYELTVRENVVLGRPEPEWSEPRVRNVLCRSRSEGFVQYLAGGLDARVGRLFEGARDLSGGQWQRLALARVMYRDADVWVLDEPTAALDPESEAQVFTELKLNLQGRIGIVISHRFSNVRCADRIAVIAGGRVAELGTHEELMCARGRYAQLFDLQATGYR